MKTKIRFFGILLMAIMLANTISVQASPLNEKPVANGIDQYCDNITNCAIPNLTDKQSEEINKLRIAHKQAMLNGQNQMNELKAKLKTLETAENPDLAKIHDTIDEIAKQKAELDKKMAVHKQQIRGLLNDEQRLAFDTHKNCTKKNKFRRGHQGRRIRL